MFLTTAKKLKNLDKNMCRHVLKETFSNMKQIDREDIKGYLESPK